MKDIFEFTKKDYSILRKGPYYATYQYKHLLKIVIEILDFLFADYKERENIVFVIPPQLSVTFIYIKALMISIEEYFRQRTKKEYTVSKLITDLQDDPEEIFRNWQDTREIHVKALEGWEVDPRISSSKFSVNPYVAKLIGVARKELKKLEPARKKLTKLVKDSSKPETYEVQLLGTTLSIKTSHLGTIILHPNFHYDRVPFRTIEYLLTNPNKKITKVRLEKEGIKTETAIDELLRNMGFLGDIGKAFISSSTRTVTIRNLITTKDIIDLGIIPERLDLELLTLK